jgi:hypothetical protein
LDEGFRIFTTKHTPKGAHRAKYTKEKTLNRMDRIFRIKKMDKRCFLVWFYPEYPVYPVQVFLHD